MSTFFSTIIGWFGDMISALGDYVMDMLPDSPFQALEVSEGVSLWLGWINYFLPINQIVAVMQAWILAVSGYFIYMAILRWIKAIE